MMNEQGWVGLADAVAVVRAEIDKAEAAGRGSRTTFEIDSVELEFVVELRQETASEAGAKAWVLSAGLKGSESQNTTNKMKVTLNPKNADGTSRKVKVSDPSLRDVRPDELG